MIRPALALAALLFAAPAHAATSCYVGLGAGKSVSAVEGDEVSGPISVDLNGLQISGRAGCDTGLGPLVVGAFAGYDFTDIESDMSEDYASVGARLGYKVNDGTLAYGLLGIAAPKAKFGSDERGTLYGAGLEIDFGSISPGLVGYVEWNRVDWRQRGDLEQTTDTVMVGARIKLDLLK
jgi:opacity protein-like surface antigen